MTPLKEDIVVELRREKSSLAQRAADKIEQLRFLLRLALDKKVPGQGGGVAEEAEVAGELKAEEQGEHR